MFCAGVVFGVILASSHGVTALNDFGETTLNLSSVGIANTFVRDSLDLLQKMVATDPQRRISCQEDFHRAYNTSIAASPTSQPQATIH